MASTTVAQPSFVVAIHTAVRGRVRLWVAGLYHSPGLKNTLESRLNGSAGIRSVSANILTGNILVLFDPDRDLNQIVEVTEFAVVAAGISPDPGSTASGPEVSETKTSDKQTVPSVWSGLPNLLRSAALATIAKFLPDAKSETTSAGKAIDSGFWSSLRTMYESAAAGRERPGMSGDPSHQGTTTNGTYEVPGRLYRPWHLANAEDVVRFLEVSASDGLSVTAAAERLRQYGPNVLPPCRGRSALSIFIGQFKSLPVLLLLLSAVISALTGGMADAVMILVVVQFNAAIGFFTEFQAEEAIRSLLELPEPKATVIREGTVRRIRGEEVTLGDILVLDRGHHVVADARLVDSMLLAVDESALTGESMPVEKSLEPLDREDLPLADRINMVYRGTVVTGGSGLAVVVATGIHTELGIVQCLIAEAVRPETPIERQLRALGNQLVWVTVGIAGTMLLIGMLRGLPMLATLQGAIALAVAAVPEGLPVVATTALASGVNSLLKHKVLVRHLEAVEALGTVQVICFDKTGTLTTNQMAVMSVFTGMKRYSVKAGMLYANGKPIQLPARPEINRLLEICALCNEAKVRSDSGKAVVKGSATESALLRLAMDFGMDVNALRQQYPLIMTGQRTQKQNYMTTRHAEGGARRFMAVKGSPAEVLALSGNYESNGRVCRLTRAKRRVILAENERMAGSALRVLGFAYKKEDEGSGPTDHELIWLGLVGIADPTREGLRDEIIELRRAGVRPVMLTGDQTATACAVGRELELGENGELTVLESTRLSTMNPEELSRNVPRVDVYSRVSPAHKLQIVRAYQQAGMVVAMTGDGVNDGPALKAAEIGIAMGESGTQVAREVADIILLDDNLKAMIPAVREGRRVSEGIRKSIHYTAATNTSEIFVVFAALAAGLGQPLNARQLLMINIVSDVFPELALALAPAESDLMKRPPRDPKAPLVSLSDSKRLGAQSLVMTGAGLAGYAYGISRYGLGPQASGMAFATLLGAQMLHGFSARSERSSVFDKEPMLPNRQLRWAVGAGLGVLSLSLFVPGLRGILGTGGLGLVDALVCAGTTGLSFLGIESMKTVWRRDDATASPAAETEENRGPVVPSMPRTRAV